MFKRQAPSIKYLINLYHFNVILFSSDLETYYQWYSCTYILYCSEKPAGGNRLRSNKKSRKKRDSTVKSPKPMTTEHRTTRSSKKRGKAEGNKEEHSTESVQKKCGKHLNAKYDNSGENNI